MFLSSLKKEALIVLSDIHSLAVLLFLPIVFMLIMTFAMSEKDSDMLNNTHVYVHNPNNIEEVALYETYIMEQGLNVVESPEKATAQLVTSENFAQEILSGLENGAVSLTLEPNVTPQKKRMVVEYVKLAFSKTKLHLYMLDTGDLSEDDTLKEQIENVQSTTKLDGIFNVIQAETTSQSVTLYSVPSWIVFGIYFIVLPISITTINEKHSGALIRLKTFPVTASQFFMAKLLAFVSISVVQFCILFVIGIFCVPYLTEQPSLEVQHWPLMFLFMLIIAISANCFAFLIASLVNSFEQAIVFGGGINIILAALSGFMVPIDVMPAIMADIAKASPLYWSAELIRVGLNGIEGMTYILYSGLLISFSVIAFVAGLLLFNNKIRNLTWN